MPPGGVDLPDGRHVPAGTRIGMAIYHIHYNETLFLNPRLFSPERWLGSAEEIATQTKFMVAFSRGSRSCLGIKYVWPSLSLPFRVCHGRTTDCESSLAYMEMYMAIAYIVRRFDLQLAGTTEADMVWDDMVVPQFHGEFKVMTKRRTE